ncbi:methyl-accepting chemotaxis protein [Serratia rubidaea]|uniref:methyl-accepting chemotaxis protein n=1 Tax=Serratia rubidaea TaxID=61652 RepID=UPI0023B08A09|nr:methyl-accepting chemotaxis protein [Serratia rubidaea]MDK1702633.1 methyl-accepting chemotaxis protein [Serratia rubidaea]
MFNRVRISISLYLLMFCFCLMQLISTGLSFSAFRADSRSFTAITQGSQQRDVLTMSRVALLQARNSLNRAGTRTALRLPAEQVNALLKDARRSLQSAERDFRRFQTLAPAGERARSLTLRYQQLHAALLELSGFLASGNLQAFMDQPTQQIQTQFETELTHYLQQLSGEMTQAQQTNQRAYTLGSWMLTGAVLMLFVVAGCAIWWQQSVLLGPLKSMRRHFERIAAGDLATPVVVTGNNEISALFAGLRQMQQSLTHTVGAVQDGTEAMLIGLQEIAEGNNDLSSRTEQQAASLEETAASMEQLTSTVKQNVDNARQATQLARDASAIAAKGGELAGEVVNTMHAIASSSQKIGAITGVIDGIAFQTNILALNAAVEAARAGEQGRGFAVVAGEVRSLAQRSAQAAKEIKGLIDESVGRVRQGSTLVEHSGDTMQDIVRSVTRVTDIMGEITSASDEQSRGIEQVTQAVTQMDQVTQQNAALVVQAASAASGLEEQAIALADAVSVFRLADAHAGASPSDRLHRHKETPDCQTS